MDRRFQVALMKLQEDILEPMIQRETALLLEAHPEFKGPVERFQEGSERLDRLEDFIVERAAAQGSGTEQ